MLRSAASALLRSSAEISVCALSTVPSVRSLPSNRPLSTSLCLCQKKKKKKKTSLWLQPAKGAMMEGNMEEILAPLRLAVKEQVTFTVATSVSCCLELV